MVAAGHTLICIPYDSGYRNLRMGAGPTRLMEAGAARCLEQAGAVSLTTLEAYLPFQTEIGTAFELPIGSHSRGGKPHERAATDCSCGQLQQLVGTVAGIQRSEPDVQLGVIWFDGHATATRRRLLKAIFSTQWASAP